MPRASAPHVEVVVTISDSHRSKSAEVLQGLKSAGLASPQALPAAGVITGKATGDALAKLRAVKGVAAVETSGTVQIAPPDAEVQ